MTAILEWALNTAASIMFIIFFIASYKDIQQWLERKIASNPKYDEEYGKIRAEGFMIGIAVLAIALPSLVIISSIDILSPVSDKVSLPFIKGVMGFCVILPAGGFLMFKMMSLIQHMLNWYNNVDNHQKNVPNRNAESGSNSSSNENVSVPSSQFTSVQDIIDLANIDIPKPLAKKLKKIEKLLKEISSCPCSPTVEERTNLEEYIHSAVSLSEKYLQLSNAPNQTEELETAQAGIINALEAVAKEIEEILTRKYNDIAEQAVSETETLNAHMQANRVFRELHG